MLFAEVQPRHRADVPCWPFTTATTADPGGFEPLLICITVVSKLLGSESDASCFLFLDRPPIPRQAHAQSTPTRRNSSHSEYARIVDNACHPHTHALTVIHVA
jgi:hypothetical protein